MQFFRFTFSENESKMWEEIMNNGVCFCLHLETYIQI